jgi:pyrimidine-nucleoside phosphorylase
MNTVEIIKKKRDGRILTDEEINFLINSYTERKIPDYQFSSFLMAAFLRGLSNRETSSLTKAMLYSGKIVDLSKIKGKKVDKHSTGGVGDKTSLILAPIVAAAGVNVPMISGRGLGHSGGTLDKLDTIPGFNTKLSLTQYKKVIEKCGAVLIGQTKDIAPADKLIYALRDVTGTIESIPLITGSIMSKKLAEGIDGLVLDVKTGSGAFMKTLADSKRLANTLISTAKSFKKDVIALVTDMNQPLGHYIGNWMEVHESVNILKGEMIQDLYEVTLNLSGAMIHLGGKASSIKEGYEISAEMIKSGKAFDKLLEIVKTQNGQTFFIKNPEKYPKTKFSHTIYAEKSGYLSKVNNYNIGIGALELGAGRMTKEDRIDPSAGIDFKIKIGDRIKKGNELATIYTNNEEKIEQVSNLLYSSLTFTTKKCKKTKLIKALIK